VTDAPDLFAAAELRTCGTCSACCLSRLSGTHCCDWSLRDVKPEAEGCGLWMKKKEE
jgi:hypothetical protein